MPTSLRFSLYLFLNIVAVSHAKKAVWIRTHRMHIETCYGLLEPFKYCKMPVTHIERLHSAASIQAQTSYNPSSLSDNGSQRIKRVHSRFSPNNISLWVSLPFAPKRAEASLKEILHWKDITTVCLLNLCTNRYI